LKIVSPNSPNRRWRRSNYRLINQFYFYNAAKKEISTRRTRRQNQRPGQAGQYGTNQPPKRDPNKKKVDPLKLRNITYVDYRDIRILERFLNDRGKILPNRITGVSTKYQRKIEIRSSTPDIWHCCLSLLAD